HATQQHASRGQAHQQQRGGATLPPPAFRLAAPVQREAEEVPYMSYAPEAETAVSLTQSPVPKVPEPATLHQSVANFRHFSLPGKIQELQRYQRYLQEVPAEPWVWEQAQQLRAEIDHDLRPRSRYVIRRLNNLVTDIEVFEEKYATRDSRHVDFTPRFYSNVAGGGDRPTRDTAKRALSLKKEIEALLMSPTPGNYQKVYEKLPDLESEVKSVQNKWEGYREDTTKGAGRVKTGLEVTKEIGKVASVPTALNVSYDIFADGGSKLMEQYAEGKGMDYMAVVGHVVKKQALGFLANKVAGGLPGGKNPVVKGAYSGALSNAMEQVADGVGHAAGVGDKKPFSGKEIAKAGVWGALSGLMGQKKKTSSSE
ncbi:MAG: hypothetical protein D6722_10480, partial [Bacteroidetes bacterium]